MAKPAADAMVLARCACESSNALQAHLKSRCSGASDAGTLNRSRYGGSKFRMSNRVRTPVVSARFVPRRGARAIAADMAGTNAFVVCARWSMHCVTDHDLDSRL